jgi:hypothetical protein
VRPRLRRPFHHRQRSHSCARLPASTRRLTGCALLPLRYAVLLSVTNGSYFRVLCFPRSTQKMPAKGAVDCLRSGAHRRCPQSDSNRHWTDFKSAASANWAMGASAEVRREHHRLPLGPAGPPFLRHEPNDAARPALAGYQRTCMFTSERRAGPERPAVRSLSLGRKLFRNSGTTVKNSLTNDHNGHCPGIVEFVAQSGGPTPHRTGPQPRVGLFV